MFTGIVTDLGTVREVLPIGGGHDHRMIIGTSPDFLVTPAPVALGASIACSGVCLTAVELGGDWFAVEASAETLSGEVVAATPENGSVRWRFRAPRDLAPFIAPKGSIAIDGVSLTVNEVDGDVFGVNIIPHTATVTTFGTLQPGARINLEIDMMARYVARLREYQR